jgi:hypothetical protein
MNPNTIKEIRTMDTITQKNLIQSELEEFISRINDLQLYCEITDELSEKLNESARVLAEAWECADD